MRLAHTFSEKNSSLCCKPPTQCFNFELSLCSWIVGCDEDIQWRELVLLTVSEAHLHVSLYNSAARPSFKNLYLLFIFTKTVHEHF